MLGVLANQIGGVSMGSMRQMIRPSSISILTVVVLRLVAADASGLCALVKPKEAKEQATSVLERTVTAIEQGPVEREFAASIAVPRVWKGGGSEKQ